MVQSFLLAHNLSGCFTLAHCAFVKLDRSFRASVSIRVSYRSSYYICLFHLLLCAVRYSACCIPNIERIRQKDSRTITYQWALLQYCGLANGIHWNFEASWGGHQHWHSKWIHKDYLRYQNPSVASSVSILKYETEAQWKVKDSIRFGRESSRINGIDQSQSWNKTVDYVGSKALFIGWKCFKKIEDQHLQHHRWWCRNFPTYWKCQIVEIVLRWIYPQVFKLQVAEELYETASMWDHWLCQI